MVDSASDMLPSGVLVDDGRQAMQRHGLSARRRRKVLEIAGRRVQLRERWLRYRAAVPSRYGDVRRLGQSAGDVRRNSEKDHARRRRR